MKTFTATHLNKLPSDVFEAAKEDGAAVIEHSRYRKGVFAIVWNPDDDAPFERVPAKGSPYNGQ